jgi:type III secretion protein D
MSPDQDRIEVAIESGLHAGACQTLPAGRLVIGSGIDADICLADDGVAPDHAVIDLRRDGLVLEALAADVAVDGGVLRAGTACALTLPSVLELGDIRLRLADPAAPAERAPRIDLAAGLLRSRRAYAAAAAALAVCTFLVVPNPVADAAIGRNAPDPAATASVPAPEAAPLAAKPLGLKSAARKTGSAEAVKAVAAEVERAGLLNVTVAPGNGVVTATGTIEPAAAARWQGVQQWFDERFAGDLTLVNAVAVKAERLPSSIAIEAVWRGDRPYLIVRGQKHGLGSLLDGGWAIERIEAERVLLKRDGRLVAVRY